MIRAALATSSASGAIAVIHLEGDVASGLHVVTQRAADWTIGHFRLTDLAGVDRGIAVRTSENTARMPHGGPRVVSRLLETLARHGMEVVSTMDAAALYPEAADTVEARMLAALAKAPSRLAIDLLLDQPRRLRETPDDPLDAEASARLRRLLDPPNVVLAGEPNVGKSTLTNALAGRSVAIAFNAPGTTRDAVRGMIDLAGLVVHWHDTPGCRTSADSIEMRAIENARTLMRDADYLIAMRAPDGDWPELIRPADLLVTNKIDIAGEAPISSSPSASAPHLSVSATNGRGLDVLVRCIRDAIVPAADCEDPRPWPFDTP